MIEQQHAIGDVFFQTLPRQRAVAALGGDDGRHAAVLQPVEQPPDLGPQDGRVGKGGEQALDRVEHDALGAYRIDCQLKPQEKAFEVVIADLGELGRIDGDVFEGELVLFHEFADVEAERGDVCRNVYRTLLEGHEHAGLVQVACAMDQERRRKHRLAAAGGPADKRWPSGR